MGQEIKKGRYHAPPNLLLKSFVYLLRDELLLSDSLELLPFDPPEDLFTVALL
jgi:hypothetical protein